MKKTFLCFKKVIDRTVSTDIKLTQKERDYEFKNKIGALIFHKINIYIIWTFIHKMTIYH